MALKMAHFVPSSFLMVMMVAMHGKYSRTNSMKEYATNGEIIKVSSLYRIFIVLTITSFAINPDIMLTPIFQSKPSGAMIGSIVLPMVSI